jgi:hypothetical protein
MALLKNEVREFLRVHFNNIRLESPLFFKSPYGLRFDLQDREVATEEYFRESVSRAKVLFEHIFNENDNILFYLRDFKWKRRKLRFSNYCFRKITELSKDEIEYHTLNYGNNNSEMNNVGLIRVLRHRINHSDIFEAIANKDFSITPGLDQYGFLSDKKVYFINLDKQIIFHMYDDRGLDVIAGNRDALIPTYIKFKDWILDCNRDKIDETFNNE